MFRLKATPKERELFTYLARGIKTVDIAYLMNIAENTANRYRLELLRKNRYESGFKMVCDYYMHRVEALQEKNKELQETLTKVRKELRYYKYASKRG